MCTLMLAHPVMPPKIAITATILYVDALNLCADTTIILDPQQHVLLLGRARLMKLSFHDDLFGNYCMHDDMTEDAVVEAHYLDLVVHLVVQDDLLIEDDVKRWNQDMCDVAGECVEECQILCDDGDALGCCKKDQQEDVQSNGSMYLLEFMKMFYLE